jgi:ATP-dependent exoDNAse (exonuclease V) alpha subunit
MAQVAWKFDTCQRVCAFPIKSTYNNVDRRPVGLLERKKPFPSAAQSRDEKAVAWCERRTGKTLAPSQREALKTVLANRVVIIAGGPGVGNTTLVNSILMILRAKGVKCLLCAPTGRAAKRLGDHGLGSEDDPPPA